MDAPIRRASRRLMFLWRRASRVLSLGKLRRFRFASTGSVLTLFAVTLPVLIGSAALGVDVGVFYLEQRALQKGTDMAALAAAADLDHADAAVRRMLAANGQGDARFALSFGRYRPDPAIDPDERFTLAAVPNAVEINATREVPTLFGRIFAREAVTVSVRSRATVAPVVSFAIGSRLASADPSIVDALLVPLIGTKLGLDILDYRALVRSQMQAGPWLRTLAAADGLPSDTLVGTVLRRPLLLSAILSVSAGELNRTGDPVGAAALRKAARNTVAASLRVAPGDLFGFDSSLDPVRLDYPSDALSADVSVLSMLSAAVTDRSIGNAASASLGLPGLLRTDVGLTLGEAEQGARAAVVGRIAEPGPSAGTAQARLRAELQTTLGTALPGVGVDVPIELVAAGAQAVVTSVTCSADPSKREVRLAVTPGILRVSLGRSDKDLQDMGVSDAVRPARIAAAPGIEITVGSSIALRSSTAATAIFRGSEIGNGTVKTFRTRRLAESLMTTLVGDAVIDVRLGPLSLALPSLLTGATKTLLAGLVQPVDTLIDASLAAAGIGLGEADVRVDDLTCGRARLL